MDTIEITEVKGQAVFPAPHKFKDEDGVSEEEGGVVGLGFVNNTQKVVKFTFITSVEREHGYAPTEETYQPGQSTDFAFPNGVSLEFVILDSAPKSKRVDVAKAHYPKPKKGK